MEKAALIVQIESAVVMVSIRLRQRHGHMGMVVRGYRLGLIHVKRMVSEQRQERERLRSHEHRQQRRAKPPNASEEPHGLNALP